jgi:flagellar hook-length control protein FliK
MPMPPTANAVMAATLPSGDASVVSQAPGKASAIQATDKRRLSDKVETALASMPGAEAPVKGHDAVSEVTSLLNSRQATASSGISQVQAELREVRTHQLAPVPVVASDVSRLAQAMASVNGASSPAERTPGKLQNGTTGAEMEGLLGTALADKLGMSPTYEVAPATAVVADTQVAETVSYWATHGVQSAELTLDGLGNEPVEVRISVDGDQTQVDFRSNQPEVRQALESASAQLKTMLSGEGLQLTGMSIGTSGRGQTPGEGGQPKPSPRQTTRVSLEPAVVTTARVANLSVGQALDLYV